jgi:cytoskeletal protein RodZ
LLLQAITNPQTQKTASDAFAKWAPYAIPAGGVLISFFSLIISWFNRKDARRAEQEENKAERESEKQMQDQAIRMAIAELGKRINERLEQRAKRSFRFQSATAMVLFLLISGIGGYLWIVTARIQSAIQPDQLKTAISQATQAPPPAKATASPVQKKGTHKPSGHAPVAPRDDDSSPKIPK